MNQKINLWIFWYCSCIWESTAYPMSYHNSKEGAEKAMNKHKNRERRQWLKYMPKEDRNLTSLKFGMHESWSVDEFELEILP
jgi:hypothetical protein